jgi:predicted dehydrogenase
MEKLRGGLFGCGMISEFHLRGWQRIPEVEIVALGNRTISRAEARRDQYVPGARVYADLAVMLREERLDFVDILSVPWMHRAHCSLAREAGVHVICQKPLCSSLEEARLLVREMAESPRLFAVHENHRYRPWFRKVLALHREGFFGTPLFLRLEQYDSHEPPERYKVEAEQGVLLEYGTHLVDMMAALLRGPRRVYATLQHLNPKMRGESHAFAMYEYAGASAVIDIAWQAGGPPHGSFLLQGPSGVAYYEGTMARGASARFRVLRAGEVEIDETRSPYDDYVESFYLFEREWVDCVVAGRPVTQSGEENLIALVSTFAAYAAAQQGRVVEVAPFPFRQAHHCAV